MPGAGCASTGESKQLSLEAKDPHDRVRAIVSLVEDESVPRRDAVAALVNRLEDEDDTVRFYAIAGLVRLTGHRLGYRPFDPAQRRRLAVERWRDYVQQDTSMDGPAAAGRNGRADR